MWAEVPILQLKCACCRGFRRCGGDQRAMKTDEVCDRPLETFGAHPCFLSFIETDRPENVVAEASFPLLDVLHVLHHQRGAHAGQRAEENAAEHQDSHVVRQL